MKRRTLLPTIVVAGLAAAMVPVLPVRAWGPYGHELSARAAAMALPPEMPEFFRTAVDQLVYLNPEPDRWRDGRESRLDPALNGAHGPEHFVNLELVPEGALEEGNRFDFLRTIGNARNPGLAPYRILELYQRVRLGFRTWREESDPAVRAWIEQRILNDAGILGHYVTDTANPLHTTIHFDGWVGTNPADYSTSDGIHARFESAYVDARVGIDDLRARLDRPARVWTDPRRAVVDHIQEAFALVESLYLLDRADRFGPASESPQNHDFVVERLASGALALRDAWWSAWVTSDPAF